MRIVSLFLYTCGCLVASTAPILVHEHKTAAVGCWGLLPIRVVPNLLFLYGIMGKEMSAGWEKGPTFPALGPAAAVTHRLTETLLHSCSFESCLTCDTFRVQELLGLRLFGLYFLYWSPLFSCFHTIFKYLLVNSIFLFLVYISLILKFVFLAENMCHFKVSEKLSLHPPVARFVANPYGSLAC